MVVHRCNFIFVVVDVADDAVVDVIDASVDVVADVEFMMVLLTQVLMLSLIL